MMTERLYVSLPDTKQQLDEKTDEKSAKQRSCQSLDLNLERDRKNIVESRLVRSRLDFQHARVLQSVYGFPRPLVARTLRIRFENYDDDFESFGDFYHACCEAASAFGIQTPRLGERIIIPRQSQRELARVKEDGRFVGENTNEVSYTGYSEPPRAPIPGLCWNCFSKPTEYVVKPCMHCSLCRVCATTSIPRCPQCNASVTEINKQFVKINASTLYQ